MSSTHFTLRPSNRPNSLAWPRVEVKSFFPGLDWWASSTTFDFDNLFKVGRILRILVSSMKTLVSGFRGELMSTRTSTVRPSRSTSSRVRTFAINHSQRPTVFDSTGPNARALIGEGAKSHIPTFSDDRHGARGFFGRPS